MVKILAALIIITSVILGITSVWNDSPIVDEIPHIGAGYSYITKGDFRLNPEHPPLAKDLAGITLQLLNLKQGAFETEFWKTNVNGQWDFGRNLIFQSGNDAVVLSRAAKLPIFVFFILAAIIVHIWTKKLYGDKASFLALFLFSFSPTVMAHSRFVTTDVPALFGVLVATYFFIKFLYVPGPKNLIIAGLVFGVAQLTKFSLFLLVPYFLLLAAAYGFLYSYNKLKHSLYFVLMTILIMTIGYIFVVWPVYALHTRNYPPERQRSDTIYDIGNYKFQRLADRVIWASDKPIIRPMAQYGLGLLMVAQRSLGGNTAYFMGEIRSKAWKSYFPFVYLVKEPLAFWALLVIVFSYLISKSEHFGSRLKTWVRENFAQFAMLLWIIIYWYTSITANLNIGVRHLMPVYGFTYILIAGPLSHLYEHFKRKTKLFTCLLFVLLGWYIFENIKVYPYYLTYFNQLAGGPSGGHLYVVDSNLDWGQDAKRLADWLKKNNIQDKIYLDFFGWTDPSYYYPNKYLWLHAGKYKSLNEFFNENLQGGWIAISATFYMNSRESADTSYAWLDSIEPITVIGNSIFVWHIVP